MSNRHNYVLSNKSFSSELVPTSESKIPSLGLFHAQALALHAHCQWYPHFGCAQPWFCSHPVVCLWIHHLRLSSNRSSWGGCSIVRRLVLDENVLFRNAGLIHIWMQLSARIEHSKGICWLFSLYVCGESPYFMHERPRWDNQHNFHISV